MDQTSLRREIQEDLRKVAESIGHPPTYEEYAPLGSFSKWIILKEFEAWTEALRETFGPKPYDRLRDPAAFIKLVNPKVGPDGKASQSVEPLSEQEIVTGIAQCAEELLRPPSTVTWYDFREHCRIAFGKNSKLINPRSITMLGGFNTIRDAHYPPEPSEILARRDRLKQHAQVNRRLGSQTVRKLFEIGELEEWADRIFAGKIEPSHKIPGRSLNSKSVIKSHFTLVLSDNHIGADLLEYETGALTFGRIEESRRLASIIKRTCEVEHASESKLTILLAGDHIQGWIHDPADGAVLAEQQARAIHLFIQVIAHAAHHFKEVEVICTSGNHGRNAQKHPGRATFQKWDSHETVIFYAISKACKQLGNVEFKIPKTPYYVFEIFGRKALVSHGDTVFNPGQPGKSVATKSLESQVNAFNAKLPDSDEIELFIFGHVHVRSNVDLNNGATVLTNGPMIPVDNYAVSIGVFESNCSQSLIRSDAQDIIAAVSRLKVTRETDQDASLDKIIQPWVSLEE